MPDIVELRSESHFPFLCFPEAGGKDLSEVSFYPDYAGNELHYVRWCPTRGSGTGVGMTTSRAGPGTAPGAALPGPLADPSIIRNSVIGNHDRISVVCHFGSPAPRRRGAELPIRLSALMERILTSLTSFLVLNA